jgi:hypothetical protein
MQIFPLRKVVWRDGDVITQEHFHSLEEWIENLVGIANQHFIRFGLFRNSTLQQDYNRATNISVHLLEETQFRETQFRIDIERFQSINPYGRILKIDDRTSLNLRVQLAKRSEDGFIIVYIAPIETGPEYIDEIDRNSEEVLSGTRIYTPPCRLTTSNDNNDGVPILRFKIEGGHLENDDSYVPFGLHLDSSTKSFDAHEIIIEKFERYRALIRNYFQSLRPTSDFLLVWEAASNLYRLTEGFAPVFKDSSQLTEEFFRYLQQFVNLAKAEINILNIGFEQDYLRQKSADILEILDKPAINISEQQYDLTLAFEQANEIIEAMMKYLEYLPAGPISEIELAIDKVEFAKVAGSNKLTVYLADKVEFKKGKTLMTIYLRSYSKAEPINKNVRVGLGEVSQAMLKDMLNALKPIPGEQLSYRIECPKEIINRDSTSIITIYVPTPIGEGVPDLKRYLSINIRE